MQLGSREKYYAEGAYDDLHVHITADCIEKVDAAVALIEPLLTPVDVSHSKVMPMIHVTCYILYTQL